MNRLVTAVTALLLLTGCGGERPHEPAAKPSTPTSSTTAAQIVAVEDPPRMGRLAKKDSAAGALAFAEYYLEIRNDPLRTGRTASLRQATAPQCLMCLTVPTLVEAAYGSGGRIEGGLWEPRTKVSVESGYPGGQIPRGLGIATVAIHLTPMTIFAGDGKATGTYPGSDHDRGLTITMGWRDGRWTVEGILTIGGQLL